MSEKIIRDPVHDVIAFRLERPADSLLFRLINAVEFQRLRRIRQLGMASLAYPGADHSRYSHSLGVMETARKILDHLGRSFYIAEDAAMACQVAALLHDLGHGPFSHVFERVSGVHHETLTQRVILESDSQVNRILVEHDPKLPDKVVELIAGESNRDFLCDILSSQLDADRLDYLLRDNLMTGSRYGNYDLRWLLHAFTIDEKSNRLAIDRKGVSAVEAYLQSRYHMYRNVYFHKVVRSAEGMVKLALQRARMLAENGQLDWPANDQGVQKALMGQLLSITEFTELDDVSVTHCFKIWSRSPDAVLARLCSGLLNRRVYKTIDLLDSDAAQVKEIVARVDGAISAAGGEPAFDMFYDEPADTPYEPESGEILVRDRDGSLREFAEMSSLPKVLNKQLMFRRLHVFEEFRDVAEQAVRFRT